MEISHEQTLQSEVDAIKARVISLVTWLNKQGAHESARSAQNVVLMVDELLSGDVDPEESYP